ncbi:MAG: hypothetical protein WBV70_02795 [Candidatus Bathyarchaeia archaeon]
MSKIGSMEGARLVVFRIFFSKVKRYLSMNPGAVFIVGFQSLLLACACLLIEGNFAQADNVAMYAFCLLVVGVVLKAISFLRHGGEGDLG